MEDTSFERVSSGRVVLRRFQPGDASRLAAYRSDPAVARMQDWETPYSQAEALAFIQSLAGLAPGTPGRWFQFAVCLAPSDDLVGDLGLHCLRDDPSQAELGATLAASHQGTGLAVEAGRRLLRYAFEELGLHRIVSHTDVRNAAAQAALARLGFRREGGERAGEYRYALLRTDWLVREASPSEEPRA